jgi:hypothetical protein
VRVVSANRLEFRPNVVGGCVVYNDGRQVACTEGDFVTFSPTASLSLDELECIVEHARNETKRRECARELCEAARRMMDAHGLPIPDDLIVSIARMGAVNPDLNVRLDMRHGCWPDDRTRVEQP